MLLAHEITTYHAPYPDRIERDVESVGGATRALRLGRPVLRRAPRSDRVYWTTEEYQRDYSARSALALGLRILRAQRHEDAHWRAAWADGCLAYLAMRRGVACD